MATHYNNTAITPLIQLCNTLATLLQQQYNTTATAVQHHCNKTATAIPPLQLHRLFPRSSIWQVYCNTLQHTATHYNNAAFIWQVCCNTLQHTTTTLQQHCNSKTARLALRRYRRLFLWPSISQSTAMHGNAWQHTTTTSHCNTLQQQGNNTAPTRLQHCSTAATTLQQHCKTFLQQD